MRPVVGISVGEKQFRGRGDGAGFVAVHPSGGVRPLPLIAGAAIEESSHPVRCTGFRRRPTPMSSGMACPFRSSPSPGPNTAVISDISASVTPDPGRCSVISTTRSEPAARCARGAMFARRTAWASPPSADAARRSWWARRRARTGTRSHVWSVMHIRCRSDPPPATPELRSVAQDLTMPALPRLMDRMWRRCRHRGRAPYGCPD